MHRKLKTWKERLRQIFILKRFCTTKVPSVYKEDKNYHPQVYVEECKYTDTESQP